ncbi:MAG: ribosome recycling factor [Parcubacteria bacterium C7867-001]|nr:MAG: ribosome recycling factor [Parcubacteria bacterium C7867-001]
MAYDFSKLKTHIKESEEWLQKELSSVRTGRASTALLDRVKFEVYGAPSSIQAVGSVSVEDARTIRIVPWDKTVMKNIEKGITEADLGVSVVTDDQGLRIIFPELTGERRTMLAKLANEKTEQARITLRGHRTEAIKELDAAEKEGGMGQDELKRLKDEVQKMIDAANASFDGLLKKKQEEIAL